MAKAYGFDPYAAEAEEIARKRQYGDMLAQQMGDPIQPYTSGGVAAPIHFTQGLAKMLQGYNAGAWRREAESERKTLNERYQRELADTLRRGTEAQVGAPARVDEDASGNVTNTPAMAPNPTRAAEIFMGHPATLPMGMQAMQHDMALRAVGMTPGGGAASPSAPAAPGGPQQGFGPLPDSIKVKLLSPDPRINAVGQAEERAWREYAKTQAIPPHELFKMEVARAEMQHKGLTPPALPGGAPVAAPPAAFPQQQSTPVAPQPVAEAPIVQAKGGKFLQPTGAVPPEDYQAFIKVAQGAPITPGGPQAGVALPADTSRLSPQAAGEVRTEAAKADIKVEQERREAENKLAIERKAKAPQARQAVQLQVRDLDGLTTAAKEIEAHPGLVGATGVAGKVPSIPGNDAAKVEALIASLKAQISGMKLQAMRNSSPTGGAVGNVTEKEWPRLEGMIVALDPVKLGAVETQKKLRELRGEIEKVKRAVTDAFTSEYGERATDGQNDPLGIRGGNR